MTTRAAPPAGIPREWTDENSGKTLSYRFHWAHPDFLAVRFDDGADCKVVIPFTPNGNGNYKSGAPPAPRALFGRESLTNPAQPAFIHEGQKCAAAGLSLGLPSVACFGGAQSPEQSDWKPLQPFKDVCLVLDNDKAGEDYGRAVAGILASLPWARTVRVVRLPGLPDKGDICDWIKARLPAWDEFGPIPREPGDDLTAEFLEAVDAAAVPMPPDWLTLSEKAVPDAGTREPLPLRRTPPPPESFSTDALGDILGNAARTMHEVIKAPLSMCGQSVLAAASLAVQGHADVVIDGRVRPLSLYCVTVGESGDRKSEVDRNALWAHRIYERELALKYEINRDDYSRAKDAYDAAYKYALNKVKGKGREASEKALAGIGPPPQAPLLPLLLVEEPTYEGLVKLLECGLPSVGLFSDEGGRLIGGHAMNKDNLLKTLAGFSNLWDGKPVSRVRSGDGATILYGRRMAFHLMVQPAVATVLFGNELANGQGFLGRVLSVWPDSIAGTRTYVEVDIAEHATMKRYGARLLDILRSPLPLAASKGNELQPRRLPLSLSAKRVWIAFYNEVEPNLADGRAFVAIKGFGNKAAEHAARMAGVLTLLENIDAPEIGQDAMDAGIALAKFYLSEALRLADAGATNPDLILAEKLLAWAQQNGGVIALRQVYQYGPSAIRDAGTARRIVTILETHGRVVRIERGAEIDGMKVREAWRVSE